MNDFRVNIAFNAKDGMYTVATDNAELAQRFVQEVFFDNSISTVSNIVSASKQPTEKRKYTKRAARDEEERESENPEKKTLDAPRLKTE